LISALFGYDVYIIFNIKNYINNYIKIGILMYADYMFDEFKGVALKNPARGFAP